MISDGQWNNHNSAMSSWKYENTFNVKTFAVGFAVGTGNRSNYDSLADAGGTEDALYANSSAQLLSINGCHKTSNFRYFNFYNTCCDVRNSKGNFVYQSLSNMQNINNGKVS